MTLASCSPPGRCPPLAANSEPAPRSALAAVVLAGGQGRRLGGTDKPAVRVGHRSLVGAVVAACDLAGVSQVIIVGPVRDALGAELADGAVPVVFTSENPPGAGPVPALRAGLAGVTQPWVLVLAADLPFLTGHLLRGLVDAAALASGAVLADDLGNPQWLTSCWATAHLSAALASYQGNSLRGVLGPLPHAALSVPLLPGEPPYWRDCDTPADLAAAARWESARPGAQPRLRADEEDHDHAD
jgi:molybdopterin-guanine dinucleotide biosynthesis protein A